MTQYTFKLPIETSNNSECLQESINTDIELYNSKNNHAIYNVLFNPTTTKGKDLLERWTKQFSYNTEFLTDSQHLYKKFNQNITNNVDQINELWSKFKQQDNFHVAYNYIDWKSLMWLNNNPLFLQLSSIQTLLSPIFIILLPILLLFIPFFILKFKKIHITPANYILLLKNLFHKHPLGKIFNLKNNTLEQNAYSIFSLILYFFNIYQNSKSSITFIKNMKKIKSELKIIKAFILNGIELEKQLLTLTTNLNTYTQFNKQLEINIKDNESILLNLEFVDKEQTYLESFMSMGKFLKAYYYLYDDHKISNSMNYLIDFYGYIDQITGLHKSIEKKLIGKCTFNIKKKAKFSKAYYGLIDTNKSISNCYKLNKNYIITGPNASGKTTLLKTTLINVIISQQVGFGFYKSANIHPYKQIHCYLNIPDTSDRDSLFQAEARRCKSIIDNINQISNKNKIFCIFDELYSGTNPYEATASAQSFLEFLSNKNNVTFMITTHYIELCKNIRHKKSQNYNMEIQHENKKIKYTYKLKKGINETKGGVSVLKNLNYPQQIIEKTETLLANSFSRA